MSKATSPSGPRPRDDIRPRVLAAQKFELSTATEITECAGLSGGERAMHAACALLRMEADGLTEGRPGTISTPSAVAQAMAAATSRPRAPYMILRVRRHHRRPHSQSPDARQLRRLVHALLPAEYTTDSAKIAQQRRLKKCERATKAPSRPTPGSACFRISRGLGGLDGLVRDRPIGAVLSRPDRREGPMTPRAALLIRGLCSAEPPAARPARAR